MDILLVEDNRDVRESLADLLEMEGYSVAQAAHGLEGLRALAQARPRLILLDLMMPVMSGQEFLAALRQQPASPPVLVLTGSLRADGCGAAPVAEVLQKPVDVDVLLAYAARYCGREVSIPAG